MRVGFIGLGRLGLPIASVLSQHHEVIGYDPAPSTAERLRTGHPWEEGLADYLGKVTLAGSLGEATEGADVVVVCVQTPHADGLDGTTPTTERAPFDLSYVRGVLFQIEGDVPVVLMSTVLPGDCRQLANLIEGELIYAPAFPAMGTTVQDFLHPEFKMLGIGDARRATYAAEDAAALFKPVWGRFTVRDYIVSWETAELAKMAYNTAIGLKIGLANTVGWLAEKVGADGGEVMRILGDAHRRITSPAYLSPGLGDGGACHPRDQIALSWLAQQHGVYDLFGALIEQRSAHSEWIASIARALADREGIADIVILGSAYKAESSLTDGSPAILLAKQTGWPIVERPPTEPACIVIGVPHSAYKSLDLSQHLVIDPWGLIPGAVQVGR